MASATQEIASVPGWSLELEDRIKDLRDSALTVCLVAVALFGLLLLRVPASLLSVERSLIGTFLVLSLVGVTFWVRSRSYLQAAWLLFLGSAYSTGGCGHNPHQHSRRSGHIFPLHRYLVDPARSVPGDGRGTDDDCDFRDLDR